MSDFGLRNSDFGVFLHPFTAVAVMGFFMGFLGLGIWDFWGFFLPIDLCRAKVRYLGGIMAILGSKHPILGPKMVDFGSFPTPSPPLRL